jgi:four helix bundle protein
MELAGMRAAGHTVKELVVWQRAMATAEAVYRATALFPSDERFGLTIQCRRAAVSIAANIAEGHGRRTPAYFVQSLRLAQGSTSELDTQLDLACRLGYLGEKTSASLHEQLDHVSRLITKLSHSLLAQLNREASAVSPRAPRPAPHPSTRE